MKHFIRDLHWLLECLSERQREHIPGIALPNRYWVVGGWPLFKLKAKKTESERTRVGKQGNRTFQRWLSELHDRDGSLVLASPPSQRHQGVEKPFKLQVAGRPDVEQLACDLQELQRSSPSSFRSLESPNVEQHACNHQALRRGRSLLVLSWLEKPEPDRWPRSPPAAA